jgi:phage major head subunit gpT-like protein
MALPGILSNVANKFLLSGFTAVEQAWRNIASIRSVSDFKQVTSYRLNGAFQYDEVASNGELKHDTVSESSFTNQAKTYGKMFAVTRQDIINDDLGALTALPTRIGRGGALKLNDVFWTAFMNNSSFFASGNNNYLSGATTNFGIDSLTSAEQKFFEQTDVDGKPLAVAPRILLVPPALNALAAQTMRATEIRDTTASTKIPTANPHAGKFDVVMSAYLSNSAYSGYSAKKWYLLADPMDLSAIEVAFLNGVETPTVESADADFNVLGIQMRGYFDFGVAKQEPRAGVAVKGEA